MTRMLWPWLDEWIDETVELLAGCVLLIISGSFWFHMFGAVWSSWHNASLTAATVLGPWMVARAWHRRGDERDRAAKLAREIYGIPGVTDVVARSATDTEDLERRLLEVG